MRRCSWLPARLSTNMMKRKSQIKMTETIGILFVFFFILMLGFIFYARFQQTSLQYKKEKVITQKSIEVAQFVSFLPELQCTVGTEEGVIIKNACLDLLKLESARQVFTDNKLYYYDLFYYSTISVKWIYPGTIPSQFDATMFNSDPDNPNSMKIYENIPTDYTQKIKTVFPVLLEDVITAVPDTRHYLGVLEVDFYVK